MPIGLLAKKSLYTRIAQVANFRSLRGFNRLRNNRRIRRARGVRHRGVAFETAPRNPDDTADAATAATGRTPPSRREMFRQRPHDRRRDRISR